MPRIQLFSVPKLGFVLALASAWTSAAWAAGSDADFLAARDAYRAGSSTKLDRLAPRLKAYVLEPYVAYWQLALKLDSADAAEVRAFLEQNANMPLGDRLRSDWLKSLGRRQLWTLFDAEYPLRTGEDPELACYEVQSRRSREGDPALAGARKYWFTAKDLPDACQNLFAALLARGDLGAADIWSRFRLAHEAGNFRLAASVAEELPAADRPASRDLDRIDRDPSLALAKAEFPFKSTMGRELALYALDRAGRMDPAAAYAAWAPLRKRFSEVDRRYGDTLLAYHASRQLVPDANQWFRDADPTRLSEAQHAWRVRAALRAGVWPDVARAIGGMPAALQQQPEWRYWKARALAAGGQDAAANRLYGGLATEHNFYGILAAEAIGARTSLQSQPLAAPPIVLAAFGARDGVRRTVKLSELNMRAEAQREWVYVVRGADDETLLLAAEFAGRNKLWDRSINTADRTQTRHDFTMRYPTPYRTEITRATRENGLDEAFVYGLTRQESRFVASVVSSAGAVGLMQIMPATARWVAKQTGRADYRPGKLDEPALNVQLGAFYLRHGLDILDSMPVLAAAAYNAGPRRAQAWRGGTPLEGAIYAETIPFNETRDYVKKVLANTMFYQVELGLPYVSLKDRLGVVAPRGGALPPASEPPAADQPDPAP